MKRKIAVAILAIVFLMMNAMIAFGVDSITCDTVQQSCSAWDPNGQLVLKLSDIGPGGGHAATPTSGSGFTYNLCCDLPSITVDTSGNPDEFMISLMAEDNSHVSSIEDEYTNDLYIKSPESLTCGYHPTDCTGLDTCLFSIEGESFDTITNAHISDCSDGFDLKYCCMIGESTCSVTDVYWGIIEDEEVVEVDHDVGLDQIVFLVMETSNCEGYDVDYEINPGAIPINGDLVGEFDGESLGEGFEHFAVAMWTTTATGDFTFQPTLEKAGESDVIGPVSDVMTVNGNCAPENPLIYVDECYFTIDILNDAGCPTGVDEDCDGVDDCIDQEVITASSVDKCTGTPQGSAGCVPSLDCTNLAWSECYKCETGMPCADPEYGFEYELVMERCQGGSEATCVCDWLGGAPPPECNPDVANQWENRFKGCIYEEEFPIFDSWNFIAVLILLTGYYAFILIKKRR